MFTLTEDDITASYDRFMAHIKADSRSDALLAMYDEFGGELLLAPASSKTHFHNACPGGYIDHVVRVIETSLKVCSLYKSMGGTINFTKEELVFAATHHDLGKLGEPGNALYNPQESDWHRNRGEVYSYNTDLQYMTPTDRALFILQKYNIPVTMNEWLGIKLSDGLYDESTKSYLINYSPHAMKTNISNIIHWADHISSRVENDRGR